MLFISNSYSQDSSSDSLLADALQIQQNEMAFMYLDTEKGKRQIVTYEGISNTSSPTSSTEKMTTGSGPTQITGGSYFGEEYGEAAIYSDGLGFQVDLKYKLDTNLTSISTLENYTKAGTSIIHAISGNFTGDEKEELMVFYNGETTY
jgi:hypothetical protein